MDIFELLPVIVVVIIIVRSIISKLARVEWEDIDKTGQDYNTSTGEQKDDFYIKEESPEIDDQLSEIEYQENDNDFTENNKKTYNQRKLKVKKNNTSKKIVLKEESNFFHDNLSQDDLVKGVVFKEILGKPRSKKPYRPLNKEK